MEDTRLTIPSFCIKWLITPNDAVFIHKEEYVFDSVDADSYSFKPAGPNPQNQVPLVVTFAELYEMMRLKRAWVKRDAHAPHMIALAKQHDNHFVEQLADRQRNRVEYFTFLLENYEGLQQSARRENGKKFTKSPASMEEALPGLHQIALEFGSDELVLAIRHEQIKMPSASTLLRELNWWRRHERDPLALATHHHGPGEKRQTICLESQRIWVEHVNQVASQRRPSKRRTWEAITASINIKNARRTTNKLQLPSYSLVCSMVDALGAFRITVGQEGIEYALKRFDINPRGIVLGRIGQRVEMDEWQTDLYTILEYTMFFKTYPRGKKAELKKVRVWVNVIMDTASRYILAMRFSLTNNSENTLATVDMMTRDKTEYGAVLGAQTPWFGHCGAFDWITDQGTSYMSRTVREAIGGLGWKNRKPQAGEPNKRAFIERFFKTLKQYLEFIDGRTFANVWEKGNFDPSRNATATIDFLNQYLVRAVVDVYHNKGHSGIAKESPHVRFVRLADKEHAVSLPDPHLRRSMLGLRDERVLTSTGIVILGINYHSDKLLPLWFHHRALKGEHTREEMTLPVRIDKWDMSAISVLINGHWEEVENTSDLPPDVSVMELSLAAKKLKLRNLRNNEINAMVMWEAIEQLRLSGEAAAARAEIGVAKITTEYIHKVERQEAHVFASSLGSFRMKILPPPSIAPSFEDMDVLPELDGAPRYKEVPDGEPMTQFESKTADTRAPDVLIKPSRTGRLSFEGE